MIEEKNDMQMDFDEDAQYTERKRILFFGLPWTFTKYIINFAGADVRTWNCNLLYRRCYYTGASADTYQTFQGSKKLHFKSI